MSLATIVSSRMKVLIACNFTTYTNIVNTINEPIKNKSCMSLLSTIFDIVYIRSIRDFLGPASCLTSLSDLASFLQH